MHICPLLFSPRLERLPSLVFSSPPVLIVSHMGWAYHLSSWLLFLFVLDSWMHFCFPDAVNIMGFLDSGLYQIGRLTLLGLLVVGKLVVAEWLLLDYWWVYLDVGGYESMVVYLAGIWLWQNWVAWMAWLFCLSMLGMLGLGYGLSTRMVMVWKGSLI